MKFLGSCILCAQTERASKDATNRMVEPEWGACAASCGLILRKKFSLPHSANERWQALD
jgi:hypothetical protein